MHTPVEKTLGSTPHSRNDPPLTPPHTWPQRHPSSTGTSHQDGPLDLAGGGDLVGLGVGQVLAVEHSDVAHYGQRKRTRYAGRPTGRNGLLPSKREELASALCSLFLSSVRLCVLVP